MPTDRAEREGLAGVIDGHRPQSVPSTRPASLRVFRPFDSFALRHDGPARRGAVRSFAGRETRGQKVSFNESCTTRTDESNPRKLLHVAVQ